MPVDTTKISHQGAPTVNAYGTNGWGEGTGDFWAQWYPFGNANITKEGLKGKYLMGPLKGDISLTHNLEVKEIETGVKGKVVGVVPTSEKLEIALLFMIMTQKTDERIMGSSIPMVVTYADEGDTTVKTGTTPTIDGLTLTDGEEFKVGDTVEVPCGDTDFGIENEYPKIETINGDDITFNPPLSQIPLPLAPIRKVKSINKKAGGHKLPGIFSLQIVDQENATEDVDVYTFKKVQIKATNPTKKSKDGREGGFTVTVIATKMTYVDDDGKTKQGYILYEKDTYFRQ